MVIVGTVTFGHLVIRVLQTMVQLDKILNMLIFVLIWMQLMFIHVMVVHGRVKFHGH